MNLYPIRSAGRVLACLAVVLACALVPRAGQAQAPPSGVFSSFQTDLVPDISSVFEPATMRSRVVGVDTQQVTAARLGQETLRLNLFDDAAVAVQIDRVRPTRSGYFITGRPEGFEWGEVRLVVNGPVTVGTVVTPEGKYTIRYGGAGRHVIRQIDPSAEPPLHDDLESPLLSGEPQNVSPATSVASFLRSESGTVDELPDRPTEDGSGIRILVVYTPAFQAAQGGAAGVSALIDLMIHAANGAFEISDVRNVRLVLAHSALVDYVETETSENKVRLSRSDDGYMDEVHALRNEHAADLVHLLTRYVRGPAGISSVIGYESLFFADAGAFAITAVDSEDVFTHEIGHQFGLRHDRYVDYLVHTIYPYAFGYINDRAFEAGAPATTRWRTIMAYPDQCEAADFHCPHLLRFANPEQTHLGDPLGVAADDSRRGIEGPADARLTIEKTAPWVGSYRSEACTEFVVRTATPLAPLDGGEVVVNVETTPGCLWEASSQSGFLTIASGARHAGRGTMGVFIEPNDTGEERIGKVTVAGTTVEIRQLATNAGICARTPAVILEIAADEPCDRVTDQHLSQITELVVGKTGLSTLKAGDLAGLSNLEWLHLDGNEFSELPEDMFSELTKLKYLSIAGNELTELPEAIFQSLSNLEELSLDANAFETLPGGLFAGLSNLRVLRLGRTRLTSLPPELFNDLENLEELHLEANRLTTLPEEVFANLPKLVRLNLGNNDLLTLPGSPFAGLSQLEYLYLARNELSEWPDDVFADLASLRTLILTGTPIGTLPTGWFSGVPELRSLHVDDTGLTGLPDGIFGGLSRLESLWLAANELTTLPGDAFVDLTALSELSLAANELTSLPDGVFDGLSQLVRLRISVNELATLPGSVFADQVALEELYLARNSLRSLPDGLFAGLTSLARLDLERNPVDPLPLTLTLEIIEGNQIKAVAPTGAPFEVELPLNIGSGAEVAGGATSIAIPAGAVQSVPLHVTRILAETDTATVDIASLPALPQHHRGYVLTSGASLPLEVSLPDEVEPPVQVTGVELVRGATSLRVSWTAITGANGYKVQWKLGDEDYDDESRQAVVAGGDTVSYTITGLTDGTEYSVRVLATREGADDGPFSVEVAGTTRSGDPDVNGDGALDGDDAQIMYYAYRFASLVGDGETGGTEASRQRFLAGYSGLTDPSDEALGEMVRKANVWATEGLNEGGDINADGAIDGSDARAMNYAYRYESLLGDGEEGGAARFRLQLLGPLAGKADPTDEDLKAMLRRANELREAYSQ